MISYNYKYYGLKIMTDDTWTFSRSFFHPCTYFVIPKSSYYQLNSRAGCAVEKAIRKMFWSRWSTCIIIITFCSLLIAAYLADKGIIAFSMHDRNHVLLLAVIAMFIEQNITMARIAKFCKKVGIKITRT